MSRRRSVLLRWTGDGERFEGRGAADVWVPVDGDSESGPSPMESLLLAIAACMAIDIRMILEKGRVPVHALEVSGDGDRRPDPPRYFESVRLTVTLQGPGPEHEAKIDRAVALSRDKYCSVLHTVRPDMDLEIVVVRS